MPTITPSTSATVTVPAGLVLRGTGTGTATLGPGPQSGLQYGLDADGWVLGPWADRSQVVYITALTQIDYEGDNLPASPVDLSALQTDALKPRAVLLNGATAGTSTPWVLIAPHAERLAWQLDSGTTTTTFSIDVSDDGISASAQAFTGTYNSSTVAEISPPLMFTRPTAKYWRFNVLSGGPLSVSRNF